MSVMIQLSNGGFTIVDEEDYDFLSLFKWYKSGRGYVYTKKILINGKIEREKFMHNILMNPQKPLEVDHINRDKLDNRKINLRIVSRSQNLMNRPCRSTNSTGYKGISYLKKQNKYKATTTVNGVQKHIGTYLSIEEAISAYNDFVEKIYGECAYKNKVEGN